MEVLLLKCCFTSTETVRLIVNKERRGGGGGMEVLLLKCCFTSTETGGLLGTGAQNVHLDFHTPPQLSYGGGGRGRLYTYRYTVTTTMTPA